MNTDKHTVTIPISDYNELIKAVEFIGIVKVLEGSDMAKIIQLGVDNMNPVNKPPTNNVFNHLDFFYRTKS